MYGTTVKPEPSAEYLAIKGLVLPPAQLVFTVMMLPILQHILQMLT